MLLPSGSTPVGLWESAVDYEGSTEISITKAQQQAHSCDWESSAKGPLLSPS